MEVSSECDSSNTEVLLWKDYAVIGFCKDSQTGDFEVLGSDERTVAGDVGSEVNGNESSVDVSQKQGEHETFGFGRSMKQREPKESEDIDTLCQGSPRLCKKSVVDDSLLSNQTSNLNLPILYVEDFSVAGNLEEVGSKANRRELENVNLIAVGTCTHVINTSKLSGEQPPAMPGAASPICERMEYVESGLCWIKRELQALKETDEKLTEMFQKMILRSRKLRKVGNAFIEQQEILEEIDDLFEKEEYEKLHLIDKPEHADVRRGIERKVSNVDRYMRVGRVGRRASHY